MAPTACPKCQTERRPGQDACATCGLLVARWPGFTLCLPDEPLLDERWRALERSWQDPALHAQFLDEAARLDALDLAAARYRARLRARPGDEQAEAGLERAARLVERLQAARLVPAEPVPRWLRLAAVAAAALVLLAALWLLAVAIGHK
jgi:hypothetical protein